MPDSRRPTVVGLIPRAVRIQLDRDQTQLLVSEIVACIEVKAGSLREDHERHGALADAAVAEANDWFLEYRNLLDDLTHNDTTHHADGTIDVTASMAAA